MHVNRFQGFDEWRQWEACCRTGGARVEKGEVVRRRIESGFYLRPEVAEATARKMLGAMSALGW